MHGLERPGVEAEGEQDGLVVQLATDGRQQRHATARRRFRRVAFQAYPRVLVLAENAAIETAFDCVIAAVAVFHLQPASPLLEAHVDLADGEDEFEDLVTEFGRESEERGQLLVACPSVTGVLSATGDTAIEGDLTDSANSWVFSCGRVLCSVLRIFRWRSLFSCMLDDKGRRVLHRLRIGSTARNKDSLVEWVLDVVAKPSTPTRLMAGLSLQARQPDLAEILIWKSGALASLPPQIRTFHL